jgi:integrase
MATSSSFEKVGECLYRNPSSEGYYALVKVRGKQIKRSLRTKVLAEARRKLRDFKADLARMDPEAGRITLASLCDRYLETVQHQSPKTIRRKEDIVQRIKQHWRETPAGKVRKSDVLGWLAEFSFGECSYNLHLGTIRAVFRLGVDDRLLAVSPVDGVREKRRSRPIRQTPTLAEFRAIVQSIRNQKFSDTAKESADYVEFLGLAGLGQAEASALCWQDVSFEREQIVTFRQKTRTGFAVPIFPQLRPLLERRRDEAARAFGMEQPPPEAKVFEVADAKKALASACQRLNLPNYSSRAFRRMFITTALERGVDVKVVAQWQGHRDGGKLILDTYSHVRPVHSERMAQLMTMEACEGPHGADNAANERIGESSVGRESRGS